MTDLEASDFQSIIIGDRNPMFDDRLKWTYVEGKIEGYNNFHTIIMFDSAGNFIKQGIFE